MSRPPLVPAPGRSLNCLAMCAAADLGLRSTWMVDRASTLQAFARYGCIRDGRGLEAVAAAADADPESLRPLLHPAVEGTGHRLFNGVEVQSRLIHKRTRRFVPAALVDAPHHRAIWQITTLPFCDATWRYATDRCDRCLEVQGWLATHGSDLCDGCGRPLSRTGTEEVPAADRDALTGAVGLLHHDEARRALSLARLPETVALTGAAGATAALAALAGLVDPGIRCRARPHLPDARLEASRIAAAVAEAWRLLEGWPHAPLALMDARIAVRTGRDGDANGGASTDLLGFSHARAVHPLLRGLCGGLSELVAERQSDAVDCFRFSRICGVAEERVVAARREGRLATVMGVMRKGAIPLLLRRDAEEADRIIRGNLPYERVANRIGCPHHGVEELVLLGALAAEVAPVDSCEGVRPRIVPDSIDGFEASVLDRALRPSGDLDLPLTRAMAAVGGRLKPWSAVFGLLRSGTLPFSLAPGGGPLADRVTLRRRDLPTIMGLASVDPRDLDPMMSRRDAARTLNLDADKVVPLLARFPSSNGRRRTVPVRAVLDLAANLVFLREVAMVNGSTASAMAIHVARAGIVPGPANGFDRRQVERAGLLRFDGLGGR